MGPVFLKLLNLSIAAGWLVAVALLFRFVFKKAPKWLRCLMWAVVALRLIVPFTLETPFGLVPDALVAMPETAEADPYQYAPDDADRTASAAEAPEQTVSAGDREDAIKFWRKLVNVSAVVWAAGTAAMLAYAAISYVRVRRRVREATPIFKNVYVGDRVPTPFILGVFRPRIYIPSQISREDATLVLAHERAHIRRLDHLWKPLGFLLLALYWFNPLMWLAYAVFARDIEFACDEKVLRTLGAESVKRSYSFALVNCAAPKNPVALCPVGFAEVSVRERVKDVLSYKKPTLWLMTISVLVIFTAAALLLTSPLRSAEKVLFERNTGYDGFKYEDASVYEWQETFFSYEPPGGLCPADEAWDLSRADIMTADGVLPCFRNYTIGTGVFTDWNRIDCDTDYSWELNEKNFDALMPDGAVIDGLTPDAFRMAIRGIDRRVLKLTWRQNDDCLNFAVLVFGDSTLYAFYGFQHKTGLPSILRGARLRLIDPQEHKVTAYDYDLDGDGAEDALSIAFCEVNGLQVFFIRAKFADGDACENYLFIKQGELEFRGSGSGDGLLLHAPYDPIDSFYGVVEYADGRINVTNRSTPGAEEYYFGVAEEELGDPRKVVSFCNLYQYDRITAGKDVFLTEGDLEYCLPYAGACERNVTSAADGSTYGLREALDEGLITKEFVIAHLESYWTHNRVTGEYAKYFRGERTVSSAQPGDYIHTSMLENYNTYGYATYDLDGDGAKEYVALGYGPTKDNDLPTSDFLFTVTVKSGETVKYREIFALDRKEPVALRLEEDGRPYVYTFVQDGTPAAEREEIHKFDLSVESERIVLRENGAPLRYFDGLWVFE